MELDGVAIDLPWFSVSWSVEFHLDTALARD